MAISTNELRIGNYVYWDYIPDNVQITSIDTMHVSLDRSERSMIDIEDLDPIRLTKNWLINFGFECDNDNQFAINMEGYNWTIRLHDGLVGLDYHEYHPTKPILYVHQLQNLYFAITGNELVLSGSAKI